VTVLKTLVEMPPAILIRSIIMSYMKATATNSLKVELYRQVLNALLREGIVEIPTMLNKHTLLLDYLS
jgi:hypothetical protein